jgi:hypothetical protein
LDLAWRIESEEDLLPSHERRNLKVVRYFGKSNAILPCIYHARSYKLEEANIVDEKGEVGGREKEKNVM